MSIFLVFSGWDYYPSGGYNDLVGRFETFQEACNALAVVMKQNDWGQIYNPVTDELWSQDARKGELQPLEKDVG